MRPLLLGGTTKGLGLFVTLQWLHSIPAPAKSLCAHCRKTFQVELFKAMTGHDMTVRIYESTLPGGERCRTAIRLLERKHMDGIGGK